MTVTIFGFQIPANTGDSGDLQVLNQQMNCWTSCSLMPYTCLEPQTSRSFNLYTSLDTERTSTVNSDTCHTCIVQETLNSRSVHRVWPIPHETIGELFLDCKHCLGREIVQGFFTKYNLNLTVFHMLRQMANVKT